MGAKRPLNSNCSFDDHYLMSRKDWYPLPLTVPKGPGQPRLDVLWERFKTSSLIHNGGGSCHCKDTHGAMKSVESSPKLHCEQAVKMLE